MNTRVEGGRRAKAAGSAWETWIETQHEKARHFGILAHVEHAEPHTRVINGRVEYTEKGVADYFGTLEGGRSLATETKSTKASRFPRNEVSSKQQDHLERVARAGGLALLAIEFRVVETFGTWQRLRFAVPWLEVPWQIKRTAESVSAEDLKGWEVHSECYLKRWHAGGTPSTPVKMSRYPRD